MFRSARVDVALRAYARTQPGCRTLINEIYGIGPLTSVTILAELGDTRRFQNSRDAVRYAAAWTSPSTNPTSAAPQDTCPAKDHPHCDGRCMKPHRPPVARAAPTGPYYLNSSLARIGGNRACVAIARKLLKRSYHVLRALGDHALQPVTA